MADPKKKITEPKRNSDINSLSPTFRKKFDLWWKEVKALRKDAVVFEAKRSAERQKWLYGIGRTHSMDRSPVSRTLKSKHLSGDAVDVVFKDDESTTQIEDKFYWKGPYPELIKMAKKYGIHSLAPTETCHFEDDGKPLVLENEMTEAERKNIEAMIAVNSANWHNTDDAELKKKLEEMNTYLRSLLK